MRPKYSFFPHTHIDIFIVIHRQNSSVWLDGLDSRSWDRNPVDSNANPRFYHSATRKPAPVK